MEKNLGSILLRKKYDQISENIPKEIKFLSKTIENWRQNYLQLLKLSPLKRSFDKRKPKIDALDEVTPKSNGQRKF